MKKIAMIMLLAVFGLGAVPFAVAGPKDDTAPVVSAGKTAGNDVVARILDPAPEYPWSPRAGGGSDVVWSSCSQTCSNGSSSSKDCPKGYTCNCWCGSDGNAACGSCN